MKEENLENQKESENRSQRGENFDGIIQKGILELHPKLARAGDIRYVQRRVGAGGRMENQTQNQHREDRSDRTKRNQAEIVVSVGFTFAHGGKTDTQRHDERHGDGAGGHAAGIERNGHKAARHEKRQHQQIKADQDSVQAPAEQVAQERQHQK